MSEYSKHYTPESRATAPDLHLATAEDYAACRQVMQTASRNYSFASRFVPADKLPHVEALYALLRTGDDRVDVSHLGFYSAQAAIEDWETNYWHAFETGDSPNPVLRAYLDTAYRFGIPAGLMTAYFNAMRADLTVTRYPTFADLMVYMDGSAKVVGRAMTHILGVRSPFALEEALVGADALSVAMQLSNFLRDVGSDWQIGRVYLPQEELETFEISEDDLAGGQVSPNWKALLEFQIERTDGFYRQARPCVHMLASGRWGVMSALEIYRAILGEIRRNGYDVFHRRASASRLRRLGLALRAGWKTLEFK